MSSNHNWKQSKAMIVELIVEETIIQAIKIYIFHVSCNANFTILSQFEKRVYLTNHRDYVDTQGNPC